MQKIPPLNKSFQENIKLFRELKRVSQDLLDLLGNGNGKNKEERRKRWEQVKLTINDLLDVLEGDNKTNFALLLRDVIGPDINDLDDLGKDSQKLGRFINGLQQLKLKTIRQKETPLLSLEDEQQQMDKNANKRLKQLKEDLGLTKKLLKENFIVTDENREKVLRKIDEDLLKHKGGKAIDKICKQIELLLEKDGLPCPTRYHPFLESIQAKIAALLLFLHDKEKKDKIANKKLSSLKDMLGIEVKITSENEERVMTSNEISAGLKKKYKKMTYALAEITRLINEEHKTFNLPERYFSRLKRLKKEIELQINTIARKIDEALSGLKDLLGEKTLAQENIGKILWKHLLLIRENSYDISSLGILLTELDKVLDKDIFAGNNVGGYHCRKIVSILSFFRGELVKIVTIATQYDKKMESLKRYIGWPLNKQVISSEFGAFITHFRDVIENIETTKESSISYKIEELLLDDTMGAEFCNHAYIERYKIFFARLKSLYMDGLYPTAMKNTNNQTSHKYV